MSYDFDTPIDRRQTGSLKWDKYKNRDVLPLWVADMDFVSPPAVIESLQKRAAHGTFGYTVPYDAVVHAVIAYLRRQHALSVEPEWLVWLPGLVQGLNLCCRAVGKPGDSVMTTTPVYSPFLSAPPNSGRRLTAVPLHIKDSEWTFDFAAMEAAVTPDTRLFILCNPHNPVGRVYRREELEALADFCLRHNLILCSDEIHCDLILEDHPHLPALSLGESIARQSITLMAPSKTYNLPGLACSYAIIPDPQLRAAFRKVSRGIITEINAFGYAGCLAAYQHGEPWRQSLLNYLRQNRDTLYAFIRERMPAIRLLPMEATYLAWLDVRELPVENPHAFFEEAGVGLSDGSWFGMDGYLRLNFGCPRATLMEALEKMARASKKLTPVTKTL